MDCFLQPAERVLGAWPSKLGARCRACARLPAAVEGEETQDAVARGGSRGVFGVLTLQRRLRETPPRSTWICCTFWIFPLVFQVFCQLSSEQKVPVLTKCHFPCVRA